MAVNRNHNSSLIMYQTEDGLTKIEVQLENDTVWLSQIQMAELFQRERSVITKHINNIFNEGELDKKSNVHILHIANADRPVTLYLDFAELQAKSKIPMYMKDSL